MLIFWWAKNVYLLYILECVRVSKINEYTEIDVTAIKRPIAQQQNQNVNIKHKVSGSMRVRGNLLSIQVQVPKINIHFSFAEGEWEQQWEKNFLHLVS